VLPGEAEKREALIALAWKDGIEALARQWIPPVLHPSRREEAALVESLVEMWCRATPADHEGQIRAALTRRDARPVLPGITCPTIVIGGADDPWAPAESQREIAAAIPGAELLLIADCGHMVAVERPQAVTAAMEAWLD
jgi:pimeloyl-ACP methyl ester carboxylesterase